MFKDDFAQKLLNFIKFEIVTKTFRMCFAAYTE